MNVKMLSLSLLVLAQAGCVIVTDREDWEGYSSDHGRSWEDQQDENHRYISSMVLGLAEVDVRADLGAPDYVEAYRAPDGRDFTILRYRTHHRHSDGETTQDETTPLIFENGQLIGWGDSVLNQTVRVASTLPR